MADYEVWVRGYTRADGVRVRGYWRDEPKPKPKRKPKRPKPSADLFAAIPRTVAQARRTAREIGADLSAERYRSIEAAERIALEHVRRQAKRKRRPTGVKLTTREKRERESQKRLAAEQLAYQRMRVVRDSLDAGAPPSAIVELTRSWGMPPDLWLTQAVVDDWADELDLEDLTMSDVYAAWFDSPPGSGALPGM